MAKKVPTDHTLSIDRENGQSRTLPQPMPVQYHLTIQKSWHVPAIPTVRSSPDAKD